MILTVKIKKQVQYDNNIFYNIGDIIKVEEINNEMIDDMYFIINTNYMIPKEYCEILNN